MPDDPHVPFRPNVSIALPRPRARGFTAGNTSGIDAAGLVALNAALGRLMQGGLSEDEAKQILHEAVATWLEPKDAADANLERLLAWR